MYCKRPPKSGLLTPSHTGEPLLIEGCHLRREHALILAVPPGNAEWRALRVAGPPQRHRTTTPERARQPSTLQPSRVKPAVSASLRRVGLIDIEGSAQSSIERGVHPRRGHPGRSDVGAFRCLARTGPAAKHQLSGVVPADHLYPRVLSFCPTSQVPRARGRPRRRSGRRRLCSPC
jgi:hypothetical protein